MAVTISARIDRPSALGVQRLVGVHVDGATGVGGDREQHLGGGTRVAARRRVTREDVLEVRAAADEVGPGVERRRQQGAVLGAGGSGDR